MGAAASTTATRTATTRMLREDTERLDVDSTNCAAFKQPFQEMEEEVQ